MGDDCEHKFVHLDTMFNYVYNPGGMTSYSRVDRYFCEKCLKQEEVHKEDYASKAPSWWRVSRE